MKKQAILVGFFFLFGLIGAVLLMHGVKKGIATSSYHVFTRLPNADGLYGKSRVMIAGIIVGQIDSIRLEGEKARIDLSIRSDVKLYKDASIAKVSTGLLGDYALVLRKGTPSTGFIGDGGEIKHTFAKGIMAQVSKVTPKLMRLTKTLEDLSAGPSNKGKGALREVAESMKILAKALSQSVLQNQKRIAEIIGAIHKITMTISHSTNKNMEQVSLIIRDVRAVTKNLRRMSQQEGTLKQIMTDVRDLTKTFRNIMKNQVSPGAKDLKKTLAKLDATMTQIREISGKINKGKGTLGKLINDKKLIDKAEEVVVDINRLVKKVSLLRTNVRWRTDYLFNRGQFRSDFRILVQPNEHKFYTISLIDDPRGAAYRTRRIVRSTDPNKPALTNEETIELKDTFRFSAQINFKWWFLVLRGGIIENSGGVGLDLSLFKDHLKIKTEFFEFSTETFPRLRIYATLQFWRIAIAAGMDDLLNGTRDMFIGAGITFDDNDFKYLLSLISLPK